MTINAADDDDARAGANGGDDATDSSKFRGGGGDAHGGDRDVSVYDDGLLLVGPKRRVSGLWQRR